jgi:hypothetical protein
LMEGGNERVASRMKDIANMDIDTVCDRVVSELKESNLIASLGYDSNHEKIFNELTSPRKIGSSLVSLVIELVFLLPLNVEQVLSKSLWVFFELCLLPLLSTLASCESMDERTSFYCGELISMFEMVLTASTRLGMFKLAMENNIKVSIQIYFFHFMNCFPHTPENKRSVCGS